MTANDLYNAPVSNDTRRAVRTCTELDVLEEALAMEHGRQTNGQHTPRKSMVDLLVLRIDILKALQATEGEDAPLVLGGNMRTIELDADQHAVVQADDTIPEAGGRSTAYMAGRDHFAAGLPVGDLADLEAVKGYADAEAMVRENPAFFTAPVDAPAPVPATPVQLCASNFMRVLVGGDTTVLAALVGTMQARKYDATEVAVALVAAYRAQAVVPVKAPRAPATPRTPKAPAVDGTVAPTPSDRNVARMAAAISHANPAGPGETVVLTQADMAAGDFPASWMKHATLWSGGEGSACPPKRAALACGYTAKFKGKDGTAVLTPVPAAE